MRHKLLWLSWGEGDAVSYEVKGLTRKVGKSWLYPLFLFEMIYIRRSARSNQPLSLACKTIERLIQITVNISFKISRLWSQPQAQT